MSDQAISPDQLAVFIRSTIRSMRADPMQIGVVRRIVHDFATTIAYCEPSVYLYGARKKHIQPHHPISRLLANPCEELNAFEFWRVLAVRYFTRSNSYAEILRSGGRVPCELALPKDQSVVVRRDDDGNAIYHSSDGDDIPNADMLHFRGIGLDGLEGRDLFGDSLETELADSVLQYAVAYFRNGAKMAGFFSTKNAMSPDEKNQVQRIIDASCDPSNSHTPLILGSDVSWNSMAATPEASQLLESRAASNADIARLFGYPLKKLTGEGDDNTRQEFLEAVRLHIEVFEAELTHKLLTREERLQGYGIEYNLKALRRSQDTSKVEAYKSLAGLGVYSGNEAREDCLNLEPDDDPKMDEKLVAVNNLSAIGAVDNTPNLKPASEVVTSPKKDYSLIRPVLEDVVGRVYRKAQKAIGKNPTNLEAEKDHMNEVCSSYANLAGVPLEGFVGAILDGIEHQAEPESIVNSILGGDLNG